MSNFTTQRFLIGLAIFNVAFHLVFYYTLEYHRDELLYFSLGQHPAVGYASVPPLIGWISGVVAAIFGYTEFAVRLVPALLGGAIVLLTAGIARELQGKSYAQVLAGVAVIFTPFAMRTFYLYQPVCFDVTFWTLLLYLILRYLNTGKGQYLIVLGVVSGVAMLNKYLVALLILILLLTLLLSSHRTAFRRKEMYQGLLAAFLIFLPNLIWQLVHGLPVIHHMQELNSTQLVHVAYGDFLSSQLLMPFAATLLTVPGLCYLLMHPQAKKYRLLGWTAVLVIVVLMLLRGKSYYTMGIFPMLIAAGAVFYENLIRITLLRWALPLLLLLLTLPLLPMGIPVYGPNGLVAYFNMLESEYGVDVGRRFEDGTIHSLPQDYADMIGWEELTAITRQAYAAIPPSEKGAIYCENYGQAGAISIIGKQYGLPQPMSFSDSFWYWVPDSLPPDVTHLIYINDEMGEDVKAAFGQIKIVGKVSNIHAREHGTTVYLCSSPRESVNTLWQQALEHVRSSP
ncbi:MAG: glycosyltransferase family 39 protein [Cyclobacteriaceae bacterium]